MATVSSTISSKTYELGSTTAGPFLVGYRIFDGAQSAMRVYVNGVPTSAYTLTATFADGYSDGAQILLDTARPAGTKITIESVTPYDRPSNYQNGDPSLTRKLNIEQGRQAGFDRDVRRDVDRSVKVAIGAPPITLPDGGPDKVLMWDNEGEALINGPNGSDIANAAIYAAQAQAAVAAALALSPNAFVENVAALVANTTLTYTTGQAGTVVVGNTIMTRQEGFSYQVVSGGATNGHIETAGGVRLRVRAQSSVVDLRAFNADNTGVNSVSGKMREAVELLALGGGGTVFVGAGTYKIDSAIELSSSVAVVSLGATLEFGAGNISMFHADNVNFVKVVGFNVRNTAAYTTGSFVYLENCDESEIEENWLVGCPSSNGGSIAMAGPLFGLIGDVAGNRIRDNRITGSLGVGIGLLRASRHNRIERNDINDCVGAGISLTGQATANTVSRNSTRGTKGPLVFVNYGCDFNLVAHNQAAGCENSGIEVVGNHNIVTGNHCRDCHFDGIRISGAWNTVTANACLANGRTLATAGGISVLPGSGGSGQNNLISANTCDDNFAAPTQAYGISAFGTQYSSWAAGEVVAENAYRVRSLNIYRAHTAGTAGSTAPTHLSGIVSDGSVLWEYLTSFGDVANAAGNVISGNKLGRTASGIRLRDDQAANILPVEQHYGTVKFHRGIIWNRRQVSGSASVTKDDYLIGVRSAANCTITLPPAAELTDGREIVVKNELESGFGTITISANGSTINGLALRTITTAFGELAMYWAGDRWIAFG